MSGIYIPNIEMPKECGACPFETYYSGGGYTKCIANGKLLAYDFKPIPFDGKPDWCPIVKVPDGHGDLIDKQELLIELGSEHINGIDAIRNAKTWKNDWTSGLHTAWRIIDDASTIIPTEEGE